MPIDLSDAITSSLNATTNRQEVNTSRVQESFDAIEAAINNLSGNLTFDPSESVFDTRAAAVAAGSSIASLNVIGIRGQTTLGDSPMALYLNQPTAAVDTGASFEAGGRHWHLIEWQWVTEVHFGADQTGATDSSDAVQNWIDWANHAGQTSSGKRNVTLWPQSPTLLFDKPIWLSRGSAFQGSNPLKASRPKNRNESNRGGTVFLKNFSEGPLLLVQGDRDFHIEGICFRHNIDDVAGFHGFDMRNIRDNALWEAQKARPDGAPETFILIDGLVGDGDGSQYQLRDDSEPEDGAIPVPSWDTIQTLYGRLQSSAGLITRCSFEQCFDDAITVQPGDESNGDFIDIISNNFESVRYGVTVETSQARSMTIEENKGFGMKDFVTTAPDGAANANGRINGSISKNSFAYTTRIATFHDTATGGAETLLDQNYIESGFEMYRITGGGSGATTLKINNSLLNIVAPVNSGGVSDQPAAVIKAGSTAAQIVIDGWSYNNNTEFLQFFDCSNIEIRRLSAFPKPWATAANEHEWLRIFMNACCGIYTPITALEGLNQHNVKFLPFDEDTDAVDGGLLSWTDFERNPNVTRDKLIPLWQMWFRPGAQRAGRFFQKMMQERRGWSITSSSPTSSQAQPTSLTNRILTVQMGSLWDQQFAENVGGAPGDCFLHSASKTCFGIFSADYSTGVMLAYQMNNFRETALGVFAPEETIDLTSGTFIAVNHRMFALNSEARIDFTDGSNQATIYTPRRNAADPAGLLNASTGFQVGDRLFVHPEQNGVLLNDANLITAYVDNADGTGTITFNGNAEYTEAGQEAVQFIRQPPANVATPTP